MNNEKFSIIQKNGAPWLRMTVMGKDYDFKVFGIKTDTPYIRQNGYRFTIDGDLLDELRKSE